MLKKSRMKVRLIIYLCRYKLQVRVLRANRSLGEVRLLQWPEMQLQRWICYHRNLSDVVVCFQE